MNANKEITQHTLEELNRIKEIIELKIRRTSSDWVLDTSLKDLEHINRVIELCEDPSL